VTLRSLPRARLGDLVPSLLHGQALVALVPATGERRWAGEAAWAVARAAAADGRRVALVDLGIEEPSLHEVAGITPTEGIVDAFEYDVSLTKAAHHLHGVFFIGVGSYTANAAELLGQPRWRRLHAGFRAEDALLLLYMSPESVTRLSAVPDAALVLAPDGVDAESTTGRALAEIVERGTPMLGVVRERWSAPPALAPVAPARRRPWRSAVTAAALALAGAAGWALFARSAERPAAAAGSPPPGATSAGAPQRADSLSWTVQLAAYGTLAPALQHVDALAQAGVPALVAPVMLSASGSVWYRVLVGSFAIRDSAVAARAALWAQGATHPGEGDLLQAPYSLLVHGPWTPDSLRHLGVPATRWGDGQLLIGAFETPEQAAFAEAALARAGVQATLVTRTGTTP